MAALLRRPLVSLTCDPPRFGLAAGQSSGQSSWNSLRQFSRGYNRNHRHRFLSNVHCTREIPKASASVYSGQPIAARLVGRIGGHDHAAPSLQAIRHFSDEFSKPPGNKADYQSSTKSTVNPAKGQITQRIEAARERTKTVTDKVRTSITNLNPHENIWNLPNFLTVTRLVAAPLTAYLLLHDSHTWALAVFAYAGFTDLLDGWLARRWKLQTVAGSVIDPMADKALMIIVTVTLAVKGAIPLYLATLILGRDASLAIAAIYYRYASLPAPKTMARYWDFSLPSAEVHPTTVSKYNTFLQLILIGSTLALPVVTADSHHLGVLHDLGLGDVDLHRIMWYFQWLVAGTTAWSGLSYAFLKNAVTILGSNEELKAKQGARGRAVIGLTFGAVTVAAAVLALTVDEEHKKDAAEKPRKSVQ